MTLNFLTYYLNSSVSAWRGIVFQNARRFHQRLLYLRKLGKSLNNYHLVSLLSVVSKVFERLVQNRIVDHLEKCGLFSDFQYSFMSSYWSTTDLLTVVSDRIARAFNRSGATRAAVLDISKALTGFGMLVFFTKFLLMKFQVRYLFLFLLFSVIDNFEWFLIGSLKKYPVKSGLLQGSILIVSHFSYHILMTFLIMLSVILLSMPMLMILCSIIL